MFLSFKEVTRSVTSHDQGLIFCYICVIEKFSQRWSMSTKLPMFRKLRALNKILSKVSMILTGDLRFSFASTLIRDMLPFVNPDEDYLTIVAAEKMIASSEAEQKKELEEIHTKLKGLCLFLKISSSFEFPNVLK